MPTRKPDQTTLPTLRELPNMPTEPQPAQHSGAEAAQRKLPLRRRIVAGAVALVSAVLLVLLFPHTLPAAPTVAHLATGTPVTRSATPTPTPLTPAQAWGAQSVAHYPLTLSGGGIFVPTDIAPNGRFMVGYTRPASGTTGYVVAALMLPQDAVQPVFPLPASAAPPVVKTDGTYMAWITPASAQGDQIVGYSAIATLTYHLLYEGAQPAYNPAVIAVAHGAFFWSPIGTPVTLHMTALATGMDTTIAPPAGSAFDTTPAFQVAWPRLAYRADDHSTHVYDLLAHTDRALSAIPATATPAQVQLTATALYWLHATTAGIAIARFDLSLASPVASTIVTISPTHRIVQFAATDHAIAWNDGGRLLAWDTQQHVFVTLGTASATVPTVAARGALLWYGADQTQTPGIGIIDTRQIGA
jgi:hypothetical protein